MPDKYTPNTHQTHQIHTKYLRVQFQERHLLLQESLNAYVAGTPELDRLPAAARELAPAVAETHMFLEFLD